MNNKSNFKRFVIITLLIAGYFIFAWIYIHTFKAGIDWRDSFRKPTMELLTTGHYYDTNPNYPWWLYIILIPLAIFPEFISATIVAVLCMVSFAYAGYRLGFNLSSILIFLLMPQMLFLSTNGNVDWLVVLGFIMRPQFGLFFIMLKPQVGFMVAAYWIYQAWKNGGLLRVFKTVMPISIFYFIGAAIWGPITVLPRLSQFAFKDISWDASIFPTALPIGMVLIYQAIKQTNFKKAILSTPFFSPYVAFYSWPVVMLGLSTNLELITVSYGAWLVWIINSFIKTL